jgi:hypothetical protein
MSILMLRLDLFAEKLQYFGVDSILTQAQETGLHYQHHAE